MEEGGSPALRCSLCPDWRYNEGQIGNYDDQIGNCKSQIGNYEDQIGNCDDQIGNYEDQIEDCDDQIANCEA